MYKLINKNFLDVLVFFCFSNINSYIIILTNHLGYLVIKLTKCNDKFCFVCWTNDCLIRKILPDE